MSPPTKRPPCIDPRTGVARATAHARDEAPDPDSHGTERCIGGSVSELSVGVVPPAERCTVVEPGAGVPPSGGHTDHHRWALVDVRVGVAIAYHVGVTDTAITSVHTGVPLRVGIPVPIGIDIRIGIGIDIRIYIGVDVGIGIDIRVGVGCIPAVRVALLPARTSR